MTRKKPLTLICRPKKKQKSLPGLMTARACTHVEGPSHAHTPLPSAKKSQKVCPVSLSADSLLRTHASTRKVSRSHTPFPQKTKHLPRLTFFVVSGARTHKLHKNCCSSSLRKSQTSLYVGNPSQASPNTRTFSKFANPDLIDRLLTMKWLHIPHGTPSTTFAWHSPTRKKNAPV